LPARRGKRDVPAVAILGGWLEVYEMLLTSAFRYVFSAKGAGSCKPGATPQGKVFPKASAEGANQIIAEEDAEVNRAVSAGEFLTKTWGVAPGWY
jgi:hypothetical protein